MNSKTIELMLLQLEEAFSKSRSNIYSDKKKENHFFELHNLFNAIKGSNYDYFSKSDLKSHVQILNYIFKGLEYLDNSTLNVIPYEIVSCLQFALKDWIANDNFIIVTSLSNKNLDFYFESYSLEFFIQLNSYISTLYGLKITERLIRISLPKVLSRDYLSTVVLYHELGHFIDNELNISQKLLLKNHGFKSPNSEKEFQYYRHKMEYFADLFAAQYINDASNLFLNHIASEQLDSPTHPATAKRINVVNQFLNGEHCKELKEFNDVLKKSGNEELKIRHIEIELSTSDFLNLIPQKLDSIDQLHYIFKLGWDFWNSSDKNSLNQFKNRQKYHVINNLIEKSISNFTIKQKWEEASINF